MTDPRRLRPRDGAVIAMVATALLLLLLISLRPESDQGTTMAAVTTTTTSPAASSTAVPTPTPITSAPASVDLARLRIEDGAPPGGYSRDMFPTWLDFDGNGCDARDDTLAAESLTPVTKEGCEVTGGRWWSVYDGVTITDPSQLDVDHVVPLAEAWRSGAHSWSGERRARFANHLGYDDHLLAVTASSNRSKGDSPPNGWRPPIEASWCRYATAWVTIKVAWDLTATTRERDAVGQMLDTC